MHDVCCVTLIAQNARANPYPCCVGQTYRPWEYVNLVDVEGNVAEGKLKNALQNLEEYANTVRVLGSYAVFAPALQTGPRSVT